MRPSHGYGQSGGTGEQADSSVNLSFQRITWWIHRQEQLERALESADMRVAGAPSSIRFFSRAGLGPETARANRLALTAWVRRSYGVTVLVQLVLPNDMFINCMLNGIVSGMI